MTSIDSIVLDVPDVAAAQTFYDRAFGLGGRLAFRTATPASSGFRGFTLSLVVAGPGTVDSLAASARAAGATELKPVTKSFWGYGGVVRAPDGTVWKIATSAKKQGEPVTRDVEDVVLLLGVADVKASKQFYAGHGLVVSKSFGGKYVEFTGAAGIKLALLTRKAVAKDAGVAPEGEGPHGIVISGIGTFTDPDGFLGEASPATTAR